MRILIIKPSSLGDVIHALRVIVQIKTNNPQVKIDWVIKSSLKDILSTTNYVSKIHEFERGAGLLSYIKLIKKIRCYKYDICIDLQGLLRSSLICLMSNASKKIGVADGRELSTVFYKSIGEKDRKKEIHAIDRLIPFLHELDFNEYEKMLPLSFVYSKLRPKSFEAIKGKQFIVLFPESRRSEKIWPFYEEFSNEISKYTGLDIVVVGNFRSDDFKNTIDLRGELKLSELPAIIQKAEFIVTNDSAPLHIASALCTPTVALFGPTSFIKYGPYPQNDSMNIVISSRDGFMKSIPLQSVIEAVKDLVNR